LWVTTRLLGALGPPHPFEDAGLDDESVIPAGRPTWRLAELTWPQAQARLAETRVALLPVGAIEQHGPHLPLDIDSWDAAYLCEEVAKRCVDPKPLVLPLLPYGVSYHHEDFPGTLSVSPETLARTVHELGRGVASQGIEKLLIVNGHGGNAPALAFACQLINRDTHIFCAVDTGETSDAQIAELMEGRNDAHAGEFETSTALATRPHLVYLEHAVKDVPTFDNEFLDFDSAMSVEWPVRTKRISETGTLGDPTLATAEKGEKMWAIMIDNLVRFTDFLQHTPLSELHGRGLRSGFDV
jgi:creatinine amidohydrolase